MDEEFNVANLGTGSRGTLIYAESVGEPRVFLLQVPMLQIWKKMACEP